MEIIVCLYRRTCYNKIYEWLLYFLLQLYEINDDPKRKEFLDDLFSFMQKRGEYMPNIFLIFSYNGFLHVGHLSNSTYPSIVCEFHSWNRRFSESFNVNSFSITLRYENLSRSTMEPDLHNYTLFYGFKSYLGNDRTRSDGLNLNIRWLN